MSWCQVCRNEHYFDDECPGQTEGPSNVWKEKVIEVQKDLKSQTSRKEIEKACHEIDSF